MKLSIKQRVDPERDEHEDHGHDRYRKYGNPALLEANPML